MKIGVDFSVLQTPNRMRGIGSTMINFLNHIPEDRAESLSFVFFVNPTNDLNDALALIDMPSERYEVRELVERRSVHLPLPGPLRLGNSIVNKIIGLSQFYVGDSGFKKEDLNDLDSFIQFNTSLGLPKRRGMKNIRILYDLIPYVMESEYMWNYRTARLHGRTRYRAARKQLSRILFKRKTRTSLKLADVLISISEQTKRDYIKHMGVRKPINVCHLGADFSVVDSDGAGKDRSFQRYIDTMWGDLPLEKINIKKPYLLYVGGADRRRQLNDLVGAFNNLRARGQDIQLVLTGDTLFGAKSVPPKEISSYLARSSYTDDIVYLGFTSDEEKAWLYEHALAYVFPTVYEGFGLPIIEAMKHLCPVITYKNSSLPEIAGDAVLYVEGLEGIMEASIKLIDNNRLRQKLISSGRIQSAQFTWTRTAQKILDTLS